MIAGTLATPQIHVDCVVFADGFPDDAAAGIAVKQHDDIAVELTG